MTTGMLHIGEDVQRFSRRTRQFLALNKPRVVSLIVITAVIGMFLTPGMVTLPQAVFDDVCIALMGGAAAATNWLLDLEM
jgi:protoheme IX farnesyltransferase